jgi:hypothetical protein
MLSKQKSEQILKWAGYKQENSVYYRQIVASNESGYFVEEEKIKPHWSKGNYAYPGINLDSLDVLMGIMESKTTNKISVKIERTSASKLWHIDIYAWNVDASGCDISLVIALQQALLKLSEVKDVK